MSGQIKLLSKGLPLSSTDTPELGYQYYEQSPFDKKCGTYDLDRYQLPNSQCPKQFVCDRESASLDVFTYSMCIDAMNCHMFDGMTTGVKADDSRVRLASCSLTSIEQRSGSNSSACAPFYRHYLPIRYVCSGMLVADSSCH
jgi:hypothetical protein